MFGMNPHEALYGMSYKNAIMYSRAMPMPNDETDDDSPVYDDSLDANNPDNYSKFNDFEYEEVVKA